MVEHHYLLNTLEAYGFTKDCVEKKLFYIMILKVLLKLLAYVLFLKCKEL